MPLLGCIADDITGATDLAASLVRRGLSTTQVFGVPPDGAPEDSDALVVALKSRTLPGDEAVAQSDEALRWLRSHGVEQVFLKYCSTFDSTPQGNIGPVADALSAEPVVHCPAYPENGRTVYQGHLFVGRRLLSESGMEHHPLTPMSDPDLVRVLQAQSARPVGSLALDVVRAGAGAVRERLRTLVGAGRGHLIADAVTDADIDVLAAATTGLPVLAGGAAFGAAVGARLRRGAGPATAIPAPPDGPAAVLAGSASAATQRQVRHFADRRPARFLSALDLAADPATVERALDWAEKQLVTGSVLVAADSRPEAVAAARAALGRDAAAEAVEQAMRRLAAGLVERGVRRLVVAGGETSGAVAEALGVRRVRIGPEICTGVPWTVSADPLVALAFKSGNFGGDDFFTEALRCCPGEGRWAA